MISIIIPAPEFSPDLLVLRTLREAVPAEAGVEIIVAIGRAPSVQRNAAIARARGEILVFLDSDCEVSPAWWQVVQEQIGAAAPEWDVLGGPLELPARAPSLQRLFQALLSHPLLTGRVSARYSRRGVSRASDESELILANLLVRAALFQRCGSFHPGLYPNEENEWMERARQAGARLRYEPALAVAREQRATWPAFALALLRYGRGRTEQYLVSGQFAPGRQLPPALLLLGAAGLLIAPGATAILTLGLWVGAAVGLASSSPKATGETAGSSRWFLGFAGPLVPILYALGQWWGWFSAPGSKAPSLARCVLLDANGHELLAVPTPNAK